MFLQKSLPLLCLLGLTCAASVQDNLGPPAIAWAGEPRVQELQPQTVTFSASKVTLNEALRELQRQTGNGLKDLRKNPENPVLSMKPGEFWPTLDAVCKQAKIAFSAYQPDGGIALVDTPYRELKTHYGGIFRFAFRRITVSRDEETQAHHCHVTLETAWEPRFKALYLNLDRATAVFGRRSEILERESARPVSGGCATEIELRMPAPDRATAKVDSLKGTIRVIGVPKMLEFALAKLTTDKIVEQEGVKVSLTYVNQKSSKRWSLDVLTVYPEGAIVGLDSFQQTWRDGNRVWLSWGTDPKTKRPYELEPSGQSPQDAPVGTKIQYHFTPRGETPLPPLTADVTLRHRTPNRVVAFTVPFEFRDLPLP
jgi:hypothetical protein